jgi:hypothetical protein
MTVPISTTNLAGATEQAQNGPIPPLENGGRLTRAEFERRYEAMPNFKKAELIEGEVYMPSLVRLTSHGRQHSHLTGTFSAGTSSSFCPQGPTESSKARRFRAFGSILPHCCEATSTRCSLWSSRVCSLLSMPNL